jgi:RimJ/RimL family protein N-acetyltransferase
VERLDLSPLLDLRLRTDRLELRLPVGDELIELARLAERGVHPPGEMPFKVPWTERIGQPGFVDGFVAYHVGLRDRWLPEDWSFEPVVWADGQPIGAIGLNGRNFAENRRFWTGSWLGEAFQRRGYGTEMRAAVLALGFDGLGGRVAVSGAVAWNVASIRVSEKLGYEFVGEGDALPGGIERRFELTRERWAARDHPAVEITGLDACRSLFGV